MIIEIPNENSIIKWKNDDKDEWKVTEISDLIKAYERPQGEWIVEKDVYCRCPFCDFKDVKYSNYCPNCGAEMQKGGKK